jgi:hypothetical protein
MKQPLTLLILLSVSVSALYCAKPLGPKIDVCLVDGDRQVFSCSNLEERWSLSMEDGKHLICASPLQTQKFLVECHKGRLVKIEQCKYMKTLDKFACMDDERMRFTVPISFANNYICLSELHRERIISRCRQGFRDAVTPPNVPLLQ